MTYRNERCETCRFWYVGGMTDMASLNVVAITTRKDTGPCQRHPPLSDSEKDWWPLTHAHRWCGEWKAKDEAQ